MNKIEKLFLKSDMYGKRLDLNINGRNNSINTCIGGICTIIVYLICCGFILQQLSIMLFYQNDHIYT